MGRVLAAWVLMVMVVLAVLGVWAITGETECHPVSAPPSADALRPEAVPPTESEIRPVETEPGITLTR